MIAAFDPEIPQGRYVSITHTVDVRYPHPWPTQVDFVDTPGINDPNVLRERVTMDYLRQADALQTFGVRPEAVWLSPVFFAAVACFPVLAVLLEVCGLLGGFFGYVVLLADLGLDNTAIGDGAVETLLRLAKLEVVNLYGSALTDAGLAALAAVASMAAPAGDGDGQTSVIFSFLSDTRVR